MYYSSEDLETLSYLKEFFREIVKGCRDYENLLSITIGVSTNNIQKLNVYFMLYILCWTVIFCSFCCWIESVTTCNICLLI